MSMYGVFMNKRLAVIAADTKRTKNDNGEIKLLQNDYKKLYLFDDLAVAFGGSIAVINAILTMLKDIPQEQITIKTINDIVQKTIKPNKDILSEQISDCSRDYMLEILAVQFKKDIQKNVMYHITSLNNFEFEEIVFNGDTPKSNSYSWGGYEPDKYCETFTEYCKKNKPSNITEMFLHNFQMNVDERVGGYMDIVAFDRGKLVEYDRFELKDTTSIADNSGHAIFTGKVVGGSIESNTDINVNKDASVGQYLRVGYVSSYVNDEGKTIYKWSDESGILLSGYTSIKTTNKGNNLAIGAMSSIELNAAKVMQNGNRLLNTDDLKDIMEEIEQLKAKISKLGN